MQSGKSKGSRSKRVKGEAMRHRNIGSNTKGMSLNRKSKWTCTKRCKTRSMRSKTRWTRGRGESGDGHALKQAQVWKQKKMRKRKWWNNRMTDSKKNRKEQQKEVKMMKGLQTRRR